MTKSNEYKEWVTGVFDRSSDSYDRVGPRFFTYFGRGLVEYSDIRAGARLLDVACGRGAVLIPASKKVGKSGEVIGIDISSGMVTRLETDLKKLEISNATVIRMDAEDLQFNSLSFDYVLCGLALFFFPDLNGALNEFFRVLKPGAHLVVSTFEGAETPWRESLIDVRKSYRERLASAPIMDTKDLDREEEVVEELEAVGFVEIEHMTDTYQFYFRDETEWWDAQWSIFHRAFMERLDSDSLKEYKREVTNIVRECKTDKGIQTAYAVRYSKAKKPVISMQAL